MEGFISFSKKQIIKDSLSIGKRLNGRSLLEQRKLKIVFNKSKTGVEVNLGKTKVFGKI